MAAEAEQTAAPEKPKRKFGGRPKGIPNKRTIALGKLADDVRERLLGKGLSAIDIMADNMEWAHRQMEQRRQRVVQLLASEIPEDAEPAAAHLREVAETLLSEASYRDRSQKYASELAPFIHPRLNAVAVKNVTPEALRTRILVEHVAHDAAAVPAPTEPGQDVVDAEFEEVAA